MVPVQAPVHHEQELIAGSLAAVADNVSEKQIPRGEQVPDKVHRVAIVYLDFLLYRFDG
jgi:hypothetical protein